MLSFENPASPLGPTPMWWTTGLYQQDPRPQPLLKGLWSPMEFKPRRHLGDLESWEA